MKILWLDNDTAYLKPYERQLSKRGHEVTVCATVTEAEQKLGSGRFDLLLLDVMIPPFETEEQERYPREETVAGHQTGLVFLRHWKTSLADGGTVVVVYTVRLDEEIKERFAEVGLPDQFYATKLKLRDVTDFVDFVERAGRPR